MDISVSTVCTFAKWVAEGTEVVNQYSIDKSRFRAKYTKIPVGFIRQVALLQSR